MWCCYWVVYVKLTIIRIEYIDDNSDDDDDDDSSTI